MDKSAEIRQQKYEEMFLRTQQELEKLFELSNRSQNVENENACSQNAIRSGIDNFTYVLEDEITFASTLEDTKISTTLTAQTGPILRRFLCYEES